MKRAISRILCILLTGVVAQSGFAATELEFSPDATRLSAADVAIADKARIINLNDGTLIVIWQQAAGPPDGAWALNGSPYVPHDIFIRTSVDDGTTWSDALNVSNTATLTDPGVFYDRKGDGSGLANYYGDSGKASIMAAGNNVLIAWNDTHCGEGRHGPARYEGPFGMIELPYRCLYAARLVVDAGNVTVVDVDRIGNATRDATNEVLRATGAGFALAWQEDPAGLQLGEARGEGDGSSGARVTPGTDIWYAWLPQSAFMNTAATWQGPVPVSDNFDYAAGASTGGGASRPMLAIAGSPPRAVVVYEESKNLGQADVGKYVRFHEFPANAPQTSQAGIIVSDPSENARRARVMAMMTPGKTSGARLLLMWRQGQGIQGAPADFMARVGSVPAGIDIADVPNAGLRIEDLWPAVNVDDAAASEPALNLSSANVDDASSVDPLANAKAHRAVMNGDFIYAGYTFDANAEDGIDEYQYFLRFSSDGGRSWSAPASVSQGIPGSENVIEPRLVRTPGTIQNGDPRNIHNPDIYLLAWGTEAASPGSTEPVRDSLFVTRTVDRGLSFERVQALKPTRSAADQTDEQIQLRVTPDGQTVSAVWVRKDPASSFIVFSSAIGITPTADLSVIATTSDSKPDVGDAFDVVFEVHNAGPQPATELRLTASIGDGLTLAGVETTAGSCNAGADIACNLDDLASGASAEIRLDLVAETRGEWLVSANVSAWEEEPEPGNNAITLAGNAIPNANITVHATTAVDQVRQGERFDVEFGVTNHGPQVATDVTITATLSGGADFESGASCTVSRRTLTCSVAELAVGERWQSASGVRAVGGPLASIYVSATSAEIDPAVSDNAAKVNVAIEIPAPSVGGGCVHDPAGSGDTTLPVLLLISLLALYRRRHSGVSST